MTIRELMQDNGENLGWCKPYASADERFAIAVNDGKVVGMVLNGEEIDSREFDKPELLKRFARAVNPSYDDYDGWGDLHIALEGDIRECGCADCPWFSICDAMDGDVEEG